MLTRRHGLALIPGAAALASRRAAAQAFPDQPVRLIVPFAAGVPADIIARLIGGPMGVKLGRPVVVDNRSGAGGMVGVEAAARSRPDGLTTVLASTGAVVVLPQLMPRMAYNVGRDLAPIMHVLSVPQVLVVSPRLGTKSVAELVALARRQPGKLTYGSAGDGSSLHLAGELFRLRTGTDITHVPYRGAAPAVTDLLGGTIDLLLADVPVVLPHIRAGALPALAATATARNPALPEVPTMEEAGARDVVSETWYALFTPPARRPTASPSCTTRRPRPFATGMSAAASPRGAVPSRAARPGSSLPSFGRRPRSGARSYASPTSGRIERSAHPPLIAPGICCKPMTSRRSAARE